MSRTSKDFWHLETFSQNSLQATKSLQMTHKKCLLQD